MFVFEVEVKDEDVDHKINTCVNISPICPSLHPSVIFIKIFLITYKVLFKYYYVLNISTSKVVFV